MTRQEKIEFERMIEEDWQRAAQAPMPTRAELNVMERYHEQQAELGKWDRNCECPSAWLY